MKKKSQDIKFSPLEFDENDKPILPARTALYLALGGRQDKSLAAERSLDQKFEAEAKAKKDKLIGVGTTLLKTGITVAGTMFGGPAGGAIAKGINSFIPGEGGGGAGPAEAGAAQGADPEADTTEIPEIDTNELEAFADTEQGYEEMGENFKKGGFLEGAAVSNPIPGVSVLEGDTHFQKGKNGEVSQGIDLTTDPQNPVFAEGGEVMVTSPTTPDKGPFILSNDKERAIMPDDFAKKMSVKKGKTFAEGFQEVIEYQKQRPFDPYAKELTDKRIDEFITQHQKSVKESSDANIELSATNNTLHGAPMAKYGGHLAAYKKMGGYKNPGAAVVTKLLGLGDYTEDQEPPYKLPGGAQFPGRNMAHIPNSTQPPGSTGSTGYMEILPPGWSGNVPGSSSGMQGPGIHTRFSEITPENSEIQNIINLGIKAEEGKKSGGKGSGKKEDPTDWDGYTGMDGELAQKGIPSLTNDEEVLNGDLFEDWKKTNNLEKKGELPDGRKKGSSKAKNLRYASVVGSGMDALFSALQKPEYVTPEQIENKDKVEKMDINPILQEIANSQRTQGRVLTENVSNANSLLAGASALNASSGTAKSSAVMGKLQHDIAQKDNWAKNQMAVDQYNAGSKTQAKETNAAERAGYYGNLHDSTAAFNQNLAEVGKEEAFAEIIKSSLPYDRWGKFLGGENMEVIEAALAQYKSNQIAGQQAGTQTKTK